MVCWYAGVIYCNTQWQHSWNLCNADEFVFSVFLVELVLAGAECYNICCINQQAVR